MCFSIPIGAPQTRLTFFYFIAQSTLPLSALLCWDRQSWIPSVSIGTPLFHSVLCTSFCALKGLRLLLATVPGYLVAVQVGTGSVAPVSVWSRKRPEPPDDERFLTQTPPKTKVVWPCLTYSSASFSRTLNVGSNQVFEFWSYHNMIYT